MLKAEILFMQDKVVKMRQRSHTNRSARQIPRSGPSKNIQDAAPKVSPLTSKNSIFIDFKIQDFNDRFCSNDQNNTRP